MTDKIPSLMERYYSGLLAMWYVITVFSQSQRWCGKATRIDGDNGDVILVHISKTESNPDDIVFQSHREDNSDRSIFSGICHTREEYEKPQHPANPRCIAPWTFTSGGITLVASWDGAVHAVDEKSGKVHWSFSSGSPIFSSYRTFVDWEVDGNIYFSISEKSKMGPSNAKKDQFVFCGKEWNLHVYDMCYSTKRLPMTPKEFVSSTPHILEDGSVILGSKASTTFLIDAKTGNIIHRYNSGHLQPGTEEQKHFDDGSMVESGRSDLTIIEPLFVTRTDYSMQSFAANSARVQWNVSIAEISAVFLGHDNDSSDGGMDFEANGIFGLDNKSTSSKPLAYQVKSKVYQNVSHCSRLHETFAMNYKKHECPSLLLIEDMQTKTSNEAKYLCLVLNEQEKSCETESNRMAVIGEINYQAGWNENKFSGLQPNELENSCNRESNCLAKINEANVQTGSNGLKYLGLLPNELENLGKGKTNLVLKIEKGDNQAALNEEKDLGLPSNAVGKSCKRKSICVAEIEEANNLACWNVEKVSGLLLNELEIFHHTDNSYLSEIKEVNIQAGSNEMEYLNFPSNEFEVTCKRERNHVAQIEKDNSKAGFHEGKDLGPLSNEQENSCKRGDNHVAEIEETNNGACWKEEKGVGFLLTELGNSHVRESNYQAEIDIAGDRASLNGDKGLDLPSNELENSFKRKSDCVVNIEEGNCQANTDEGKCLILLSNDLENTYKRESNCVLEIEKAKIQGCSKKEKHAVLPSNEFEGQCKTERNYVVKVDEANNWAGNSVPGIFYGKLYPFACETEHLALSLGIKDLVTLVIVLLTFIWPIFHLLRNQNISVDEKQGGNGRSFAKTDTNILKKQESRGVETWGLAVTQRINHTLMKLSKDKEDAGFGDGSWIGSLFVTNTVIAVGSNGTVILEGCFDSRSVAIKRLIRGGHETAWKEIKHLITSDQHPNVVRWFGIEVDADFVYVALERCDSNLRDLVLAHSMALPDGIHLKNGDPNGSELSNVEELNAKFGNMDIHLWNYNGYPSELLLKLLRDIVSGLAHLHELGIVHRDLRPQNVLISCGNTLCAKLADMGIRECLNDDASSLGSYTTGLGSSGWLAPEQLVHRHQTCAADLFSLGCVIFFCITGGNHPFGSNFERNKNIVNGQFDIALVEHIPEAIDLLMYLLHCDPKQRPSAQEVLHHPLFWSAENRLSFLWEASDIVELEVREPQSDLLQALESIAPLVLGETWDVKFDSIFLANISRYRRYKFDSVRDLLRVIRNKLNHYRELPKELQVGRTKNIHVEDTSF